MCKHKVNKKLPSWWKMAEICQVYLVPLFRCLNSSVFDQINNCFNSNLSGRVFFFKLEMFSDISHFVGIKLWRKQIVPKRFIMEHNYMVTFSTLGNISSSRHIEIFFLFFPENRIWHLIQKLSPMETLCLNCQFLGKIKNKQTKNTNLSSVGLAKRVVNVKVTWCAIQSLNFSWYQNIFEINFKSNMHLKNWLFVVLNWHQIPACSCEITLFCLHTVHWYLLCKC